MINPDLLKIKIKKNLEHRNLPIENGFIPFIWVLGKTWTLLQKYVQIIYAMHSIMGTFRHMKHSPIALEMPATKCYQCYADVPFEVVTLMARSASIQAVSKPQ